MAVFSVVALGTIAIVYRPLLLVSVNGDIAAAKGVRVRVVGIAYMLALAVAVGLSSIAVGAILSTALLIGPAAAALRLTKRMRSAMIAAAASGSAATWSGCCSPTTAPTGVGP